MQLLPRHSLVTTGPVDHADWNFRPVLGLIQRWRFRLILSLLPPGRPERLLEVGYGSGVFLPELATHCRALYGLDIHRHAREVEAAVAAQGARPRLLTGTAAAMPFREASFDCVVIVSALEFVNEIDEAAGELRRVLRPGGRLVMVTPGHSKMVDLGLKVLTGKWAQDDYAARREGLRAAVLSCFEVEESRTAPPVGWGVVHLYTAWRLRPRP